MLVPDPARAAREIRRVLRRAAGSRSPSGGRASETRGSASSSTRQRPARRAGAAARPPAARSRSTTRGRLAALLTEAGLADVRSSELATPYRAASVDEWWERTSALAGPLARKLGALPEPAARALRARAVEAARPYETAEGLEFPGVCLVARATADRAVQPPRSGSGIR